MYFFVFGILKNCLLDKNLIICHAFANIFLSQHHASQYNFCIRNQQSYPSPCGGKGGNPPNLAFSACLSKADILFGYI